MLPFRSALTVLAIAALAGNALAASGKVDFSKDVLPILSDKCFYCHGQDENHRKGDRRLDTHDGALAENDGVAAIVPGNIEKSDLVARIFSTDKDEMMPPPKESKKLTPAQRETLKRWVAEGAVWGKHWAFVPPVRPTVPSLGHGGWATQNAIDSFVFSRLESEKLQPSPEASRETLLRRLSLDLIGLPPSLDEIAAFEKDTAPGAYERQVDRLLASPHYGERWGRDWLDAARYADTNGFEKDAPRSAWFYRDWVIDAFNLDLPYNQFVIEQLAGDLLPNATQAQRVATGFLRNSMINEEGGVDPEQFRMEAMFDRMEAVGKSVLGLTVQCAQCHSHKFDPLPHEEYYKLFAFLNSDADSQPVVFTPGEETKRAEVLDRLAKRKAKLREEIPDWEARMAEWEESLPPAPHIEWTAIQPVVEDGSTGGQRYLPLADGTWMAAGFQPTKHEVKMTIKSPLERITAFRLDMLKDESLPAGGPGRSHLGTFGLTEFKVDANSKEKPGEKAPVKFATAIADIEPAAETPVISNFNEKTPKHRVIGPVSYAIDGNEETAWSNDLGPGRRNQNCTAIFIPEKPIDVAGGAELLIRLAQKHGGWNADDLHGNNLGHFRISITSADEAAKDTVPAALRKILETPRTDRTAEQRNALFDFWRAAAPEAKTANAEIEAIWKEYPEGTTQLELTRRPEARTTHLLTRGDWLKPAAEVKPGFLSFLNAAPADPQPNRLTLAKWLVDPSAPTTARVFVNRIWQHYFGTGIVSTAEDFGLQSAAPTHPELLDWLACEFMENGWSIKHIQRLVVTSATYRQASRITPDLLQRDPYNQLLARGPRFRMEGEIIRDVQLAASGLLNEQIGGPSVKPPAPAFLFQPPASYAPFPWAEETGPDRYRRAVYTYRRRSTPYPLLSTFDTPEGNVSCIRRNRSNTPLQALMTLNEPLAVEAAQALARRTLTDGGADESARIDFAFRCCLGRKPTETERQALSQLLQKETARYTTGGGDPWKVATGQSAPGPLPAGVTPVQLASFTTLSRVLLNLDETITKE